MTLILIIILLISLPGFAFAQPDVDFDKLCREYGLVDVASLDSDIIVDLKYATEDNFVGKNMYGSLTKAYLEPKFARRVVEAQRILNERYPGYMLLIYDAARPISVQRYMRSMVSGTDLEVFVADGTKGGRHNYGVAVDLTIATADGEPLDMGTEFDELTDASSVKGTPDTSVASTRTFEVYRSYILALRDNGDISYEAASNRIMLMEVMCAAGLVPYRREWWHFEELMSMNETRNTYKLLDF